MAADRAMSPNVAYFITRPPGTVQRAIATASRQPRRPGSRWGCAAKRRQTAAHPATAELWAGGIQRLANAVLETRRQIARWSKARRRAIAPEVMAQETTQDVQVALARLMEV